jgi:hypothetical protein
MLIFPRQPAAGPSTIMMFANGTADTNLGAGEIEFLAATSRRMVMSLEQGREFRAVLSVVTPGAAACVLGWQFRPTSAAAWTWLDGTPVGAGPPAGTAASFAAVGPATSSWTAIAAAARIGTVELRAVTFLGNGVADPVGTPGLELR